MLRAPVTIWPQLLTVPAGKIAPGLHKSRTARATETFSHRRLRGARLPTRRRANSPSPETTIG